MDASSLPPDVQSLYPFVSKHWDRGGLKLHYIDEGRGEPVVMVHGNPSWSFYYRNLALDLRETHRVIVPDHIGMGLSDKPGDDRYEHTLKSRVDDLEGLLEHLGVKGGVTLIVHDWGGPIGLSWACRHPDRVKRLVIFNTAAFLPPEGKRLPWQLTLARSPLGQFLVRGMNLFSIGAAFKGCVSRTLSPEVQAGYLAPYNSWANRRAVLRFVQDIPRGPQDKAYEPLKWLSESLTQLSSLPTLIVWGGRDFVFDDDFLSEWHARLPNARIQYLPKAGHYVLEDAYSDIFPMVRAFLDGETPASRF